MFSTAINRLKSNRSLLVVLLIALTVRIIYLCYYRSLPDWELLTVDNYYHHHWAQSIAAGNIFGDTTYFRAPFYTYYLSFFYFIFGVSLWTGRIFGLITGLGSIVLTYLIAKKMFNHRFAVIAALIHTIYPTAIYFESELLLDPLFMLLLQISVYNFLLWLDSEKHRYSLWSGIFLGLASITRPTALLILPVMVLIIFFKKGKNRGLWLQYCFFFIPVIIIIGSITLRNFIIANDPVLIASQGGINFYIGNHEKADGLSAAMPEPMGHNWQIAEITYRAEKETGRHLKPGGVSSYWFAQGRKWIIEHPGDFTLLYLKKLYYNINSGEISNNRSLPVFFGKIPLLKYNPLSFGLIFLLSVIGITVQWRRNFEVKVLVSIIAVYIIFSSLFFFNSRFRLPLFPYYFILSTAGMFALKDIFFDKHKRAYLPLLAGLFAAVVSFYSVFHKPGRQTTQHLISNAIHAYNNRDYRAALDQLLYALAIDSSFPETNLNIGACYFRLGHEDSTLFYLNREKKLHPDRAKTYINLASLYLLKGKYEKAIDELDYVMENRPFDLNANIILIRALAASDTIDNDSLLIRIYQAAERTGDNIYLLNDAAAILSERRAYSQAETVLLSAVNSSPPPIETDDDAFQQSFDNSPVKWQKEKAKAFYQLGYIAGINKNFARAIDYSQRSIELDSNLTEAYINLYNGLSATGRFREADSIINDITVRFPENENIKRLLENRGK